MNSHRKTARATASGFISAKLAIVLAVLIAGAGALTYEWFTAHPNKEHHSSAPHHHKHEGKTAAAH